MTRSTISSMDTRRPASSLTEATGRSAMPQGTMWRKKPRSADTFKAKPCMVTRRALRTPMAATFPAAVQTPV